MTDSADIGKHVIKEYKAIYTEIMNRVCRRFDQVQQMEHTVTKLPFIDVNLNRGELLCLMQVFGLKLVEIDPKNHIYILINKLEPIHGEPVSM